MNARPRRVAARAAHGPRVPDPPLRLVSSPGTVPPPGNADETHLRDVEEASAVLARELRRTALGALIDLDPDQLQRLAGDTERLRRRIRDLSHAVGPQASGPDTAALRRARAHIMDARRSVAQLMTRLVGDR